jgi:hypothetical protein
VGYTNGNVTNITHHDNTCIDIPSGYLQRVKLINTRETRGLDREKKMTTDGYEAVAIIAIWMLIKHTHIRQPN